MGDVEAFERPSLRSHQRPLLGPLTIAPEHPVHGFDQESLRPSGALVLGCLEVVDDRGVEVARPKHEAGGAILQPPEGTVRSFEVVSMLGEESKGLSKPADDVVRVAIGTLEAAVAEQPASEDESEGLLSELVEQAARSPRVVEHRWQAGDLAIWDNRRVLHRVRPYDYSEPRVMRHTRVAGDPASELAGTLPDVRATKFAPSPPAQQSN